MFTSSSVHEESETVDIPSVLHSQETYEFIGFTPQVAADIWQCFLTQPPDLDGSFLDFTTEHVGLHPISDAESGHDDWIGCLQALGINDQLSTAILLPEYDDIRFSATCKYWVLESLVSTYHALQNLTRGNVKYAETVDAIPGHHVVWWAGDKSQAARFYEHETGKINLASISTAPGDFSGTFRTAYFTPQRETADRYACWRKHKQPISEIAVIQVAVPDDFIRSLSTQYLWLKDRSRPSDEWKELIWHSKRGMRLPKDLR
ncbi:uncharacterized protein K452DRAFT_318231 [Aplosporella prunicola CBS 121167]|uniref:Uncharacterized protein n=1 Tax=Aplosporella prunicola CBS 121167 TaxID=1176127 RepID=A0A6A6BH52_9PEZI|nr:uncharacterized protein K452DRAFT_318231 [Aplosporella prunicola CBS 121167]KAF2142645.1 hypothetical protein K452DRAFT_318231 [Aplosporella prunicola CBS 121167]